MRVISGIARGHKLYAPTGDITRPTADSVKESLFNIIGNDVYGCNFLDLFAGSGAIGIEALSRGAEKAVFADVSRESISVIYKNLEKTRFRDKAEVFLCDTMHIFSKLAKNDIFFDYIFMDPPYGQSEDFLFNIFALLKQYKLLSANGICILEQQSKEPPVCLTILGFYEARTKIYSNAKITFFKLLGDMNDSSISGKL